MLTQKYINDIAYKIVGCAIEVHKHLGPGLLESVYETCLIDELRASNLKVMVGREKRNIELKHEVNELLQQLGKPKKYHSDT